MSERIVNHFIEGSDGLHTKQLFSLKQELLRVQEKKQLERKNRDAELERLSKKEASIRERIKQLTAAD